MRVLSVGAGAVGGTVAARLRRAGAAVEVFDTNREHVALLWEPGLVVGGLDDGEPVPLDASTILPDGTFDAVLLAVRSSATDAALATIASVIDPSTDVVSLQNGLNEDRIAAAIGGDRTIGCVVGFGSTWIAPGHVELDATGDLVIGRLDGSTDDRLHRVQSLLDTAFPTSITDNIRGALWAKMLVNSMTVLGALGGMLTGDVLATPERRRFVADIVAEGARVAHASGVQLLPIFGSVDPALVDAPSYVEMMEPVLLRVKERFGAIRSVTWRDFEIGRPTEIEAVTGEIVGRGAEAGVETPISTAVYAMLREIEAGTRSPAPENLQAAVAASGPHQ